MQDNERYECQMCYIKTDNRYARLKVIINFK